MRNRVVRVSGVKFFASVRERGTRVVVLANSLASNDVTPVHAGYARYREPLLHQGVELFELRPTMEENGKAKPKDKSHDGRYGSSPGVGLHAKAFAFDRSSLFVTSFNLDPRSATLNTEMGLLVDIAEVTGPFVDSLEKSLTDTAYRVEFVPGPGPCKECGSLTWVDRENGQEVRYTHEPQTSFWRRLVVKTLSLFPIEQQL